MNEEAEDLKTIGDLRGDLPSAPGDRAAPARPDWESSREFTGSSPQPLDDAPTEDEAAFAAPFSAPHSSPDIVATLLRIWRTNRALRRAPIPLVIVIVGLICLLSVVPIHHVERGRMRELVPSTPPLAGLSNPPANAIAGSPGDAGSNFEAVLKAAKSDPDHTGVYTITWQGASGSPGLTYNLFLLPSASQAEVVKKEVIAELRDTQKLSQTVTITGTFTVKAIPGSAGTSYIPISDSQVPAGTHAWSVAFRSANLAVSVYVVGSGPPFDKQGTQAAALFEDRLLAKRAGGFTMVTTSWPALASWLVIGGALLLSAASYLAPPLALAIAARRRAHKEDRRRREERSQYMMRGRKQVKGAGASPWAKPARRR